MGEEVLFNLWPAWLAVILTFIAGFHQLVTSSETVANLLGRFGRWIYGRARKRYLLDVKEFNKALTDGVEKAKTEWDAEEARSLAVVEERLEYMTRLVAGQQDELTGLNFGYRCTLAYIEYEADWYHKLQMVIILAGDCVPTEQISMRVPYNEFEQQCKKNGNTNWRLWYYGKTK